MSNDVLNLVRQAFTEARRHGEKASNSTLRAVLLLIDAINSERFGAVAPDWWTRDPRDSGIIEAVLRGAGVDKDALAEMRRDNRDNPGVAAALTDAARALARDLRDAIPCAVAMLRLYDRTGHMASITGRGIVHVPAVWYFPCGTDDDDAAPYEMQRPESREAYLTATVTKGRVPYFYLTNDGARKLVAARDAGLKPDAARMERRGEANVSREGIVRLITPKPQPQRNATTPGDDVKAPDVSDASVRDAASILASRLARDGGATTGDTADALEAVYAALVANDATWSLLVALRNKHERDIAAQAA